MRACSDVCGVTSERLRHADSDAPPPGLLLALHHSSVHFESPEAEASTTPSTPNNPPTGSLGNQWKRSLEVDLVDAGRSPDLGRFEDRRLEERRLEDLERRYQTLSGQMSSLLRSISERIDGLTASVLVAQDQKLAGTEASGEQWPKESSGSSSTVSAPSGARILHPENTDAVPAMTVPTMSEEVEPVAPPTSPREHDHDPWAELATEESGQGHVGTQEKVDAVSFNYFARFPSPASKGDSKVKTSVDVQSISFQAPETMHHACKLEVKDISLEEEAITSRSCWARLCSCCCKSQSARALEARIDRLEKIIVALSDDATTPQTQHS